MDASQSTPPNAFSTNNDNITATDTVILGAGIIGLATAYHLALSLSSTTPSSPTTPLQPSILVIEPSAHICPAASGQATGGLGDFGLGPETAALGKLSFEMFQELARSGAGEKSGFSELVVYRVALKEFKGRMKPSDEWGPERPVDVEMDELPEWVRLGRECRVQRVSGAEHGAHLDPAQFCAFLYEECVRLGVHFLFNTRAAAVAPTGTTSTQHIFSMQVHQSTSPSHSVQCRSIVIAAGPWAPRVFTTLFPAATIALPMNSTAAAGNHFRLRTPGWKPSDDAKGSVQDFFQPEKTGGKGLDVTSFMGGELYVAGWGAVPEELPVCAGDVEAQPREIADMVQVVKRWLIVDPEEELQVFDVGRCYRPLAQPDNPIIAKLPWELLGMESEHWTGDREGGGGSSIGGLFVHTAHSGDGVTLSLGSGKVMNELLLDHKPSVEISGLSL